jgi:hypothetical protein
MHRIRPPAVDGTVRKRMYVIPKLERATEIFIKQTGLKLESDFFGEDDEE